MENNSAMLSELLPKLKYNNQVVFEFPEVYAEYYSLNINLGPLHVVLSKGASNKISLLDFHP
jgi:hypothetical protein